MLAASLARYVDDPSGELEERSQIEYARLVGISPRVLIEFERGGGNPTIETPEKMLAPFGLELTLRRSRNRSREGSDLATVSAP